MKMKPHLELNMGNIWGAWSVVIVSLVSPESSLVTCAIAVTIGTLIWTLLTLAASR